MTTVSEITLHLVKLPLVTPYRVSYRVYEDFDPIIVEARDTDGGIGWGEGHISPGYSFETIEGGWAFCRAQAGNVIGREVAEAIAGVSMHIDRSPVAASGLLNALEMLAGSPILTLAEDTRVPLLTPMHVMDPDGIAAEVEARLADGFTTLKVKVGKDVDGDLARVAATRQAARGRASIRIDANRGYSEADGRRFAAALDAEGIELFEQPCGADDWAANAAVAKVSAVPVMLDESIYGLADIERAAKIEGIGFIKLKLKKLGRLDLLEAALKRIRDLGMEPVLGDGTSAEICCWMEACVARLVIDNAGEMNGYLKPKARLFADPLGFEQGAMVLKAGFVPEIDRETLTRHTVKAERISRPAAGVRAAAG